MLEALLPGGAAVQHAGGAGGLTLLRSFTGGAPSATAAAAAAAAEPEMVDLQDLLPPAIPIEQQDEQGLYRDLIVPVHDLSAAQVRRRRGCSMPPGGAAPYLCSGSCCGTLLSLGIGALSVGPHAALAVALSAGYGMLL